MVNKNVSTEEIIRMIAEISTSLDRLENSYAESMNAARCKLWAEQYKLVNGVQESLEKAERIWIENEEETRVYAMGKERTSRQHALVPEVQM